MGSQKCRIVGKSQSVLIMINPIIFTRTRRFLVERRRRDTMVHLLLLESCTAGAVGQCEAQRAFLHDQSRLHPRWAPCLPLEMLIRYPCIVCVAACLTEVIHSPAWRARSCDGN
jgi:hypothetical protein